MKMTENLEYYIQKNTLKIRTYLDQVEKWSENENGHEKEVRREKWLGGGKGREGDEGGEEGKGGRREQEA